MSKAPSTETELRNVKRELKQLRSASGQDRIELGRLKYGLQLKDREIARLTSEIEDWKRRFDALLMRTPTTEPKP